MNKKRFLAVFTAALIATMAPMTVFAADDVATTAPATGKTIGSSSSEGNKASDIFRVVLPTTVNNAANVVGTYDFILDPNGLLKDSALDGHRDDYDAASSVYFTAEKDAAKVTYTPSTPAASGTQYYVKEKAALDERTAAAADLTDIVLTADGTAVESLSADTWYVWVPNTAAEKVTIGEGQWEVLTKDTITNYFTFKPDTVSSPADLTKCIGFEYAETKACDTKLYKIGYTQITDPAKYVDYCTIGTDGTVATTELFTSTDATTYTAIPIADLTYTPATIKYIDTSNTATVTNKSTFPVVVSLDLNVTNTNPVPVKFTEKSAVDTGADLNFTLDIVSKDTASTYAVIGNVADTGTANGGYANAKYFLDGYAYDGTSNYNYKQYQGPVDPDTGGHTYYYLEEVAANWDSATYSLQADCNTSADWTAYNESLTADNRIKTETAYTITKANITKAEATSTYNYNATTKAVEFMDAFVGWSDDDASFYTAIGETTPFAADLAVADVTDLKLNGSSCTFTITGGYIMISQEQAKTALGLGNVSDLDNILEWKVTYTIDGVKYVAVANFG